MKLKYLLIILLAHLSCKSTKGLAELAPINTKVYYYDNGNIKSVGNVAAFHAKYYSYRIGLWNEFYENGKLKESGHYKLDTYTQCCTGGLCDGYYSYKIGEWVYYYPNGTLKAKGTYRIGQKQKETSCEGGDKIHFGYVTDQWNFYDLNGNKITPSKEDIAEIEKSSFIDEWDMQE